MTSNEVIKKFNQLAEVHLLGVLLTQLCTMITNKFVQICDFLFGAL